MQCEICCESSNKSCDYSCGHSMCLRCSARMVFLMEKNNCPICLDENPYLYFKTDKMKEKTDSKINLSFKNNKKIFCESKELKNEIENLLKIKCQKCEFNCETKTNLCFHYKKHNNLLCLVCLEHKNIFSDEIEVLTYDLVAKHNNLHIFCVFCKNYLFNEDTAKNHCVKKHELCQICDTKKFYEDFKALEIHWRKMHYICTFTECLNDKCYVFKDKISLMKHMNDKHKINSFSIDLCGQNDIVFMSFDKRIKKEESAMNMILSDSNGRKNKVNILNDESYKINIQNNRNSFLNTKTSKDSRMSDFNTSFNNFNINNRNNNFMPKHDSLPEYLDRTKIKNERSKLSARLEYLRKKCNFADEVDKLIEEVNSGYSTANELLIKMEQYMDKKSLYKLISNCVSFFNEKNAINQALKNCKKCIDFPKLQSVENVEKGAKKKVNVDVGFKIIKLNKNNK